MKPSHANNSIRSPRPPQKGKQVWVPPCYFFLNGCCTKSDCKFAHDAFPLSKQDLAASEAKTLTHQPPSLVADHLLPEAKGLLSTDNINSMSVPESGSGKRPFKARKGAKMLQKSTSRSNLTEDCKRKPQEDEAISQPKMGSRKELGFIKSDDFAKPASSTTCDSQAQTKSPATCHFFFRGRCMNGDKCSFSHTRPSFQSDPFRAQQELIESVSARGRPACSSCGTLPQEYALMSCHHCCKLLCWRNLPVSLSYLPLYRLHGLYYDLAWIDRVKRQTFECTPWLLP